MLQEEAIKRIKDRICNEPNQYYCRDKCLYGVEACEFSMAIDALERQIPEKPTMRRVVDIDVYYCPICVEKLLIRTPIEKRLITHRLPKYCWNCGQKLKWETEKPWIANEKDYE